MPLGDIDRDIDIFLVRGNGNLCGIDIELQVTPVQVIGAQCLQIGRQPLL